MARRNRGPWYTKAGEKVRSGLEQRVLDDLHSRNVLYQYEAEQFQWWDRAPRATCFACDTKGEAYVPCWYTPDVTLRNGTIVANKRAQAANQPPSLCPRSAPRPMSHHEAMNRP